MARKKMSMQQMDEHAERCWRYGQEMQKLDPSWGNLPLLGAYKPYSEIVAELKHIKRVNARIRAELEAEAACRPLARL